MTHPLLLYTVFHANLDFSALPDVDVPMVLERCYWPLLRFAEESDLPIGLEMPARTLERLAVEDSEWLKKLCDLAARGRIEVVGSGYAQVIGPLVPSDVNRSNLRRGLERYRERLGATPKTWFVPEQTFSAGLAELYAEIGASALIMEWNNPASRRPELGALRAHPARLGVGSGPPLALLWNDCAIFQQVQRVAQGSLPLRSLHSTLTRATSHAGARTLCAYGGDLEIFDYRPGGSEPAGAETGREWKALAEALSSLVRDGAFRFVLPRDIIEIALQGPVVELTSSEEPIPCKKQPRYNPTRWAVSGRDGLGMNRSCFLLRRALRIARALKGRESDSLADRDDERLLSLWRSDLRTRTTEEKPDAFYGERGELAAQLRDRIAGRVPALPPGWDVLIHNPWPEPWPTEVVEIDLQLAPGRSRTLAITADPPEALSASDAQVEVLDRHRDGTARRVTVIAAPRLEPGQTLRLRLDAARPAMLSRNEVAIEADCVTTDSVRAEFLPRRGGALAALQFRSIAEEPLIGTIAHGSFDRIEYTPDFYSGHVVAHRENGTKLTSLAPASAGPIDSSGALRIQVAFRLRGPFGDWLSTYRIYRNRPRIDVIHDLDLRELRLRQLRLGVATWLPSAFTRDSLSYATVNGGLRVERFPLRHGVRVEHSRAISPDVTASSCLGATEGWVSAGDTRRGVALIGDRSAAAVVPMVEFADVDAGFLLRVHHSAAETDETRGTFFRGRLRVPFAWIGHRGDLETVRTTACAIERGLVFRSAREVGIARSL